MTQPAPYPADTRAKGWRFELDYERIAQSSTWALAGQEGRPWLLMMWMTAWQQVPCGSLPADQEVIAALIGCQAKAWAKLSRALMRGWVLAEDGRLYHDTITERVLEMVQQRSKTAKRVADYKAKMREQQGGNALPTSEPRSKNDTGTGTGTGSNTKTKDKARAATSPPPPARAPEESGPPTAEQPGPEPSPAALVCRAIAAAGIAAVQPGSASLQRLLNAGAGQMLVDTAAELSAKGKGRWALLLSTVEGRLTDAAQRGALPKAVGDAWQDTRSGVEDMGERLGLGRWDEAAFNASMDATQIAARSFAAYEARVVQAAAQREGAAA